jgi:hypothetical protein
MFHHLQTHIANKLWMISWTLSTVLCMCVYTGEMLDKLVGTLPPPKDMETVDEKDKPLAIAIVGRPNVGELAGGAFGGQMHTVHAAFVFSWCLPCAIHVYCQLWTWCGFVGSLAYTCRVPSIVT